MNKKFLIGFFLGLSFVQGAEDGVAASSQGNDVALAHTQPEEVVEVVTRPLKVALPFQRVVTLGYKCTTKAAINTFFNPGANMMKTKKGHADLFDWLFIHDYECLARCFENGLNDFFEKEDFDWTKLVNRKYNMCWNHLFDSHHETGYFEKEFGITGNPTLEFVAEHMDKIFPKLKEKIEYLKEKFLSAKQQKTLYVISTPQFIQSLSASILMCLRSALSRLRGNQNFTILYVPHSIKDDIDPLSGIIQHPIPLFGAWDQINHKEWNKALNQFSFVPEIWD